MALSPTAQALTEEEKGFADRLEKEIDQKLATMPAADALVIEPKMHGIPENSCGRIRFEVAQRYCAVGWKAKWDIWGSKLELGRKRP